MNLLALLSLPALIGQVPLDIHMIPINKQKIIILRTRFLFLKFPCKGLRQLGLRNCLTQLRRENLRRKRAKDNSLKGGTSIGSV